MVIAAEAGISYSDYIIMSDEEVAAYVVGYRRRSLHIARVMRHQTYLLLTPQLKKGTIPSPKDLYLLPDEESAIKKPTKTYAEIKAMWDQYENK